MKLEDRQDVQDFIRLKIRAMLDQFSEEQVKKFKHIFPDWPGEMSPRSLADAIDLCERTLKRHCPKGGVHEWGIDGAHSNTFCKKCFCDKPKAIFTLER